ncbi:MAG: hypothetical protein AABY53_08850 [Bdellovibrionota bacterium]
MDILKVKISLAFFAIVFTGLCVRAEVCESSKEFITTIEYLRNQKAFTLPDSEIFKVAMSISENCNGSSRRFQKMLNTLVATGVDHNHALKFSLQYSKEDNESVDVFLSLFQGLVLEKKFNLPFYEAFETAKFFAENTRGNKYELKKDFLGFLDFCFDDPNGTMLPLDQCRKLSFKYLDLQKNFPNGVFKEFKTLFTFLRDQKETGLPIAGALSLTQEVLLSGPGAQKNFIDSYKYGLHSLNMKPSQALSLSLKMAENTKKIKK